VDRAARRQRANRTSYRFPQTLISWLQSTADTIDSIVPMSTYEAELRATLEARQGLPGHYFTDPAFFALEKQRVFAKEWLCVGLSRDAANKGDLFPVTILGMPLVLVRDKDRLRVFHNICSHRGAALVDAPTHGRVRLVCPYHSWTYGLSGELLRTPHFGGADQHECPGLDKTKLALREIRSAEWANHVFINLSGDAPAFEDWIRPVQQRFQSIDWQQMRSDPSLSRSLNAAANWKIIIENFAESYHLPWVHRGLQDMNPMQRHYQILGGHSYLGQGSHAYQGERLGGGLPLFSGWSDYTRYETLFIFPNLILGPLPDMTFSILIQPLTAETSTERLEFFFAGDAALADELAQTRRANSDFMMSVNAEDVHIVESVHRGRHSPAFTGGQFSEAQEATSLQLQRMVAARILAEPGQRPEQLQDLPVRDIAHPAPAA
jgi:choline monooxygenase